MRRSHIAVGAAILSFITGTGLWAGQRGAGPGPSGLTPGPIGLIVGRVVDAGTGQPIGDAQVTVSMRVPAPPPGSAAGAPGMPVAGPTNVRLLTGPDGRFVVRDLPAGNVQVSVMAPGYLNGSYGQTRPSGLALPIQISSENKVVAANIRLWKHAVVTGMVTDERNEPAVNVMVRAMARSYKGGQARFAMSALARTDDRGLYRIAGLAPGDYVVVVLQTQATMPVAVMDDAMQSVLGGQGLGAAAMEIAAGVGAAAVGMASGVRVGDQLVSAQSGAAPVMSGDGRMAAYLTQFYPSAATVADATVFTLASGEERGGVDIRMPLAATVKISGVVLGPDGPIANVQVRLVNPGEADEGSLNDVAQSMTAANGAFQMYGVPAGQYVLKVLRLPRQQLPPALANNPQLAAMLGGRGAGPASPSDSLTLFADVPLMVERDIADLALTLSTGATVSGRVEFSGTAATPPLTGINVMLTPAGSLSLPMRPAAVGEDGRFTTTGAPAGKYFINTSGRAPGWFVKSAMVNGVDALDQPFELFTENVTNVVVTYTDRQTTVNGTVVDVSGAPAQGTVVVFPSAFREWIAKGMSPRLSRSVRVQAKGAFTLSGMPGRDYLLVAVPDEQVPDLQNPAVFEMLARAATTLTLADGDSRTLTLKLTTVLR